MIRSYILSRVSEIAESYPQTIRIFDDTFSNTTYVEDGPLVYFEGNNILVQVEGSDPSLPSVLFNAHFDSVSTAPG